GERRFYGIATLDSIAGGHFPETHAPAPGRGRVRAWRGFARLACARADRRLAVQSCGGREGVRAGRSAPAHLPAELQSIFFIVPPVERRNGNIEKLIPGYIPLSNIFSRSFSLNEMNVKRPPGETLGVAQANSS